MVHSEKDVLDWLLAHCQHDRVLYNALTNHQSEPWITWAISRGRWAVTATLPRTGRALIVYVVPHPITREPHHYYRIGEYEDI